MACTKFELLRGYVAMPLRGYAATRLRSYTAAQLRGYAVERPGPVFAWPVQALCRLVIVWLGLVMA